MTQIDVSKAVVYAVEQDTDPRRVQATKAVAYAVLQTDTTGNSYQEFTAQRPQIAAGVDRPYILFPVGASLFTTVVVGGDYSVLTCKPDLTMEESTVSFVSGESTLPAEDFNQLLVYKGVIEPRLLNRLKITMALRAEVSSLTP